MKNTKIISAFPACGKSYFFEKNKDNLVVLDSDSSKFSWITNKATCEDFSVKEEKVRNPEFPANYIEHIKENIGKADYILVSSHDVVRQGLKDAGIDFILVFPKAHLKDVWVKRCSERGSDEAFCNLIDTNWKDWLIGMEADVVENDRQYYILEDGEYLSDAIESLSNI